MILRTLDLLRVGTIILRLKISVENLGTVQLKSSSTQTTTRKFRPSVGKRSNLSCSFINTMLINS